MLNNQVEKILALVQKPGRYTGGELNCVIKDKASVDIRYAFCFPDTYEIGMSHLGMKILYSLVNEREDSWCERVFAPWTDMEDQMRKNNVPLYALESGDSLSEFDLIGFTMQYELSYTNVLNMLDLAGIPVLCKNRTSLTPMVIAGGPCVCNPEPLADFIDLFLPGEGEEVTGELIDLLLKHKLAGSSKEEFLKEACKIEGVYAPLLYDVYYNDDGTIKEMVANCGAPKKIKKRIVKDFDNVFYPSSFVVPFIEVVHDRVVDEIFRGCIRGCRFCQAGYLYRPIREKRAQTVNRQCKTLCETSGYDEISLASLSTSDYTNLPELLEQMFEWTHSETINISLPSLRVDNFSDDLAQKLKLIRRSGLTFAPEAGTQRLRDVINKNVSKDEIISTCRKAFHEGWTAVKLYFMLGLPTETSDDIEGIASLGQNVVDEFYSNPDKPKGKGVTVNISASSFVPKPFTPFQWEAQDTPETMLLKQEFLRKNITTKKINLSYNAVNISYLEGIFARGDRKLCRVLMAAWQKGCKFDSWDDHFRFDLWMQAFDECGVNPEFYAVRKRQFDEVLPWDHMDYGIGKEFLIGECKKAYAGETTPNCRQKCSNCGILKLSGGVCDAAN